MSERLDSQSPADKEHSSCPRSFPGDEAIERARILCTEVVGFDKPWALAIMRGLLGRIAELSSARSAGGTITPEIRARLISYANCNRCELTPDDARQIIVAFDLATHSASEACIERCEKYLHGEAIGSICGLRKLERENATHNVPDRSSHG